MNPDQLWGHHDECRVAHAAQGSPRRRRGRRGYLFNVDGRKRRAAPQIHRGKCPRCRQSRHLKPQNPKSARGAGFCFFFFFFPPPPPRPNQLAHFAIHADDLERARKFYGGVFGWTFQAFGGGPMTDFCQISDASRGKLVMPCFVAIQSRKFNSAPQPGDGFECSITVDDVDAAAACGGSQWRKKLRCRRGLFPGVGWVVVLSAYGRQSGLRRLH